MSGHRIPEAVTQAKALLDGLRARAPRGAELGRVTVEVASLLLQAAESQKTEADRRSEQLLSRLMKDERGQVLSSLLADRAYRSRDAERLVAEVRWLLDAVGIPSYLHAAERLELGAVRAMGSAVPRVVARATLRKLREQTSSVILSAREPALTEHLARRHAAHVRLNLNRLGEAVLGEREAERRLQGYTELLARPDVEAISVKVSTLSSQLQLIAWESTLARLRPRIRRLYQLALEHRFRRPDGQWVPKLVNLDMEAYRDLHLTVELFRSVLDDPAFHGLGAGLALQAYLPESFAVQQRLTEWALARVRAGGAPIRLRLVKGANLAAETVDSSLRGWPLPIYPTKAEVDANFKRMVSYGCTPERISAVELGVASHNVFDIAHTLCLRAARGIERRVSFELLEGMAEPVRRALQDLADDVLLYAPVVDERAMQSAIAYLLRRLDENTSKDNFLGRSFGMRVGDAAWHSERRKFLRAFSDQHKVSSQARRRQDRNRPSMRPPAPEFSNEPDTDFSRAKNRHWVLRHLVRLERRPPFRVSLQIGGKHGYRGAVADGFDPSRPGLIPYRYPLADAADIERALCTAVTAQPGWQRTSPERRSECLARVALGLRASRGRLIAAMVLDGGKKVEEADAEVSEAIDFAEYYRRSFLDICRDVGLEVEAKGVALVTPPWNFPLAIPAGGALAALIAGNAVILKPAQETPWVAALFAAVCWRAGIPKEVLQLVTCSDEVGSKLVADPRVHAVVLTGGTETAQLFQDLRPGIGLLAETGGKNSMIVSALSDRDLAIQAAIHSAFGHSGQKCSATSLLICEAEVYDEPSFLETLRDAAESLPVGSAWDLGSVVTPMIRAPEGPLLRALTTLDTGESWLLEPRSVGSHPQLWTPGIKLGVREGSFTHTTELFGPVLGVMRARNLEDAVRLANATPYGLTAGLQSLDENEQHYFLDHMEAGNLYINRGTTGAVVYRQPFGGCKASSFGPGAKAGGPNYVAQLVTFRELRAGSHLGMLSPVVEELLETLRNEFAWRDHKRLRWAALDFAWALEHHYGIDHDPSRIVGEVNVFRYMEVGLLIRIAEDADPRRAAMVLAAALTCCDRVQVSLAPIARARLSWLERVPRVTVIAESPTELARRLPVLGGYCRDRAVGRRPVDRIRHVGSPEPAVARAAERMGIHVSSEPPLSHGRWELRHYVQEQSVSLDYHRYGNLSAEALLPVGAEETVSGSPGEGKPDAVEEAM